MLALLPQLLALVVSVGICAGIVVIGIVLVRRNRHLMDNGIRVLATVVDVRTISVDSSYAFEPTVRYELHGRVWESVPYDGRHALKTGKLLKTHRDGAQFIGTQLPVTVDPRDPQITAVPKDSRRGLLLIVAGTVMGVLILLFAGIGLLASVLM